MAVFTELSRNINFLRHSSGTHNGLAAQLKGVLNSNQLSRYANAESVPDDATLNAIETKLNLPQGWCRRDNLAFTQLDEIDHKLVTLLLASKLSTRVALAALLQSIRET